MQSSESRSQKAVSYKKIIKTLLKYLHVLFLVLAHVISISIKVTYLSFILSMLSVITGTTNENMKRFRKQGWSGKDHTSAW